MTHNMVLVKGWHSKLFHVQCWHELDASFVSPGSKPGRGHMKVCLTLVSTAVYAPASGFVCLTVPDPTGLTGGFLHMTLLTNGDPALVVPGNWTSVAPSMGCWQLESLVAS
jgi:hypothetical protein